MEKINIIDVLPYLMIDHQVLVLEGNTSDSIVAVSTSDMSVSELIGCAKSGKTFFITEKEEHLRKAFLLSSKDKAVLFSPMDGKGKDPHEEIVQSIAPPPERRVFDTQRCKELWESGKGVMEIARAMNYTEGAIGYHLHKLWNDGDLTRPYRKGA